MSASLARIRSPASLSKGLYGPCAKSEVSRRGVQTFTVGEDECCACGRKLIDQLRAHRQASKKSKRSLSRSSKANRKISTGHHVPFGQQSQRKRFASASSSRSQSLSASSKKVKSKKSVDRSFSLSKRLGAQKQSEPPAKSLSRSVSRDRSSRVSQRQPSFNRSLKQVKPELENKSRKSRSEKKTRRPQTLLPKRSLSKMDSTVTVNKAKLRREGRSLNKSNSLSQSKRRTVDADVAVCKSCRQVKPSLEFAKSPSKSHALEKQPVSRQLGETSVELAPRSSNHALKKSYRAADKSTHKQSFKSSNSQQGGTRRSFQTWPQVHEMKQVSARRR